ncbi:MAG: hypothetical protein KY445_07695, partial [Armatimonadetes bacterium]|nr:hypothetical protein [Armatimonadota bacterium]
MFAALLFVLAYGGGLWLVFGVENEARRRLISRLLPPLSLLALLVLSSFFSPFQRLLLATVILLGLLKCAVALRRPKADIRAFSRLGLALYFSIWPGVDLTPFKTRGGWNFSAAERRNDARALFRGATFFVLGMAAFVALCWNAPHLSRDFLGWATIATLLAMVHLGIGEMMPWFFHQIGFRVGPLFRAPLMSADLSDFWSRRWNLPFVEMDKILFL